MAQKRKRSGSKVSAKKSKSKKTPLPARRSDSIRSDSTTATITQTSRLLDLPSELLSHILSFVLVQSSRPLRLRSAKARRWKNEIHNLTENWGEQAFWSQPQNDFFRVPHPRSVKSQLLQVLLVCRAFYFDGVKAFFGGNILRFDHMIALGSMLGTLDTDRRSHIAEITVDVQCENDDATWTTPTFLEKIHDLIVKLPKLQRLTLAFKRSDSPVDTVTLKTLKARFYDLGQRLGDIKVRFTINGKEVKSTWYEVPISSTVSMAME